PNADDDLLRQIASYGRGYTYLLSRAGVTGAENRRAGGRVRPVPPGGDAP
ncbi:hypothetical protein CQA70_28440, partial [Klebsiella pneumoniae]